MTVCMHGDEVHAEQMSSPHLSQHPAYSPDEQCSHLAGADASGASSKLVGIPYMASILRYGVGAPDHVDTASAKDGRDK